MPAPGLVLAPDLNGRCEESAMGRQTAKELRENFQQIAEQEKQGKIDHELDTQLYFFQFLDKVNEGREKAQNLKLFVSDMSVGISHALDAIRAEGFDEYTILHLLMDEHRIKKEIKMEKRERARNAVNKRHDKPDGSRAKREKIRKIWASGKYSTRDLCAEEEARELGISFYTARKALINTPDPT